MSDRRLWLLSALTLTAVVTLLGFQVAVLSWVAS